MSNTPDRTENMWWVSSPMVYSSYEDIPPNKKLLFRLVTSNGAPNGSQQLLQVWAHDAQDHCFPAFYTVPFMLLSMQELACLAEIWKLDAEVAGPYWQNVHFIWNLRDHLIERSSSSGLLQNDTLDMLLLRWTVRLIHGYQNSSSEREEKKTELDEKYELYCHDHTLLIYSAFLLCMSLYTV